MGAIKENLTILKSMQRDISEIKEIVSHPSKSKLPLPSGYNPMGKRRHFSQSLRGGLLDPEIRSVIVRLRIEGKRFKDITSFIRENWPGQPEKWVSKSTCHRFWQNVRAGRLREHGIEPPVDL